MRHAFAIIAILYSIGLAAQGEVVVKGVWPRGSGEILLFYDEDAVTAKAGRIRTPIGSWSASFTIQVDTKKRPAILSVLNKRFIVLPGDSVQIAVKNTDREPSLEFVGQHGIEFEFLSAFYDAVRDSRNTPQIKSDVLQAAKDNFQWELAFMNKYFAGQQPRISYLAVVRDFIMLRYLQGLILLVSEGKISKEDLSPDYLKLDDLDILRRTDLLGVREFVMTINYFNDSFYSKPSLGRKAYDSSSVADNVSSAVANFDGEIENSLLLFIYSNLSQNGTKRNSEQIAWLNARLDSLYSNDPDRLAQIRSFRKDFDIVGEPVPASLLKYKIFSESGQVLTLGDLFRSDTALYVDLWASWCGPCMAEMPNERELISTLEGKPVRFILLSSDNDEREWQKAISKIGVKAEHYRMGGDTHMQLAKYISYNAIPRYLIIDKDGRLQSRNAPRPGVILKNPSMMYELINGL
jgi:thiol-disulfide isomerase/thioredoxin